MKATVRPVVCRLAVLASMLSLPLALGACAVVPAGPVYGPGIAVTPPAVVVGPAPIVRPYWRPWGYHGHHGYRNGHGYGRRW